MKTSLIPAILAPLGFSSCRENHVATNPPGEHKETTINKEAPRTAEKTRKLRQKPVPMATSPRRKKRQIANKCLQPLLDGGSKADRVHIGGRRFYRRLTGFQITPGFRRKSCQDLHPDHRSNVTTQDPPQKRMQSLKTVAEVSRLPAFQSKFFTAKVTKPSSSLGCFQRDSTQQRIKRLVDEKISPAHLLFANKAHSRELLEIFAGGRAGHAELPLNEFDFCVGISE